MKPDPIMMDPQTSLSLEDFVGYNLKRAYVILQKDFREALEDDDMSPRVFAALTLVVGHARITQSELARKMAVERSGLVAIVDDLEARGFLKRTHVPGDRRVQALVATEAGEAAQAHALAKVEAHESAFLKEFTNDEKTSLLRLLKKIRKIGE